MDHVGEIVDQWRTLHPELDASPMLVVGRIQRLAQIMDRALRETFARAGLGQGEFDVLAALRRAPPSCSRTAGELHEALMVTTGAVTKQVDRLASRSLVRRDVDPEDARVRHIVLTDVGRDLVDELIVAHLAAERELLSALDPARRADLAVALERLAMSLES